MLFKELIKLNSLKDSKVLTICPLTSSIQNVTFIDSPDGDRWIKEGDFVLTTGYFASGTDDWEDKFYEFIKKLIGHKGFGLGVKIGRHIPYLPTKVQKYAIEHNFPIFELNNELAWSDFLWEITNALSQAKDHEIHQLNTIYEKFHKHLKCKGTIQQLAEVLFSIIKIPLTIYIKSMNVRIDYPNEPTLKINLDYLISTAFYGISNDIQTVKYDENIFTIKWINEKNILEGGIFIWSENTKITPKIKIAVEQTAIIANLEVENQNIVAALEQRHINNFILELINGTFESNYYVEDKMKKLGFEIMNQYRLILINIEHDNETYKENLMKEVKHLKNINFNLILVGRNYDSDFTMLIPEEIFDVSVKELLYFVNTRYSNIEIRCGSSRPYPLLELSKANREAKVSVLISKENKTHASRLIFTRFEELHLERIIFSESPIEEAKQIYDETLEKIKIHDQVYNTDLLHTLHLYYKCDLNIERTSQMLFIHKNTVRYRLKSISKILDLNLDLIDTMLLLKIAFTYYHFKGNYN
ncbi:PucR family transcriptional regulator [Sporosarcina obsidiansis]|uniref:PucR family transcriptional regulator n=1 Tax=Sporosarcina obsidiansis TaxID=2660748 RepID=UPI00189184F7|nr:PucR family transcriptional regulator [Sporosarcina obsidiansis]